MKKIIYFISESFLHDRKIKILHTTQINALINKIKLLAVRRMHIYFMVFFLVFFIDLTEFQ